MSDKLLTKKYGKVVDSFREAMIDFWMDDENLTKKEAMKFYGGKEFDLLCDRLQDNKCIFNPDLGYTDKTLDGVYCFESIDNNFVIPTYLVQFGEEL